MRWFYSLDHALNRVLNRLAHQAIEAEAARARTDELAAVDRTRRLLAGTPAKP